MQSALTAAVVTILGVAPAAAAPEKWAPAVTPKPLAGVTTKGLQWLVRMQLPSGGWGQGDESVHMASDANLARQASVGDTCISVLALLRAGNTPTAGAYRDNVARAARYLAGEVEAADEDSMWVTTNRGTRIQSKIGTYVDTFLASMALSELKGHMPTRAEDARVDRALDKVLRKIQNNQQSDGSFAGDGWAPVLSQALASKGLNRAAQAGASVGDDTREKAEKWAAQRYAPSTGTFEDGGSAGVALYSAAATVGGLRDSVNTNKSEEAELKRELDATTDKRKRRELQAKLDRHAATERTQAAAEDTMVGRLADPQFTAGFGSNGGEEFLSYMLVSESLVVQGGDQWDKWDNSMARNLGRVQNADGSWTGHHCITGRTFCTAAALLVLTADRAPVPLAAKLRGT